MLPMSPIIVCSILLDISRQAYMSSTSIKDYWSGSFPSRCVSPHGWLRCFQVKILIVLTLPRPAIGIGVFFVPQTWFHDLKQMVPGPCQRSWLKGPNVSGQPVVGITWRAAIPQSPLFAGERNALDAAEVIWKTENDEAKTAKRVERILARICPRVVHWTLLVGQPSQIYLNV